MKLEGTTTRLKLYASSKRCTHFCLRTLHPSHTRYLKFQICRFAMNSSHPGGSCVGQWPLTSGWCDSLYAGPPCADRQDQGWQAMGSGKILINLPSGWSPRCHWPPGPTNIRRAPTKIIPQMLRFLFFWKRGLFQKLGLSSGLCFLIWRRLTTSKPHVSNRLRNWPSLPSSTCQGLGYLFLWGNAPAMDEIPPIATEPDCVPWNCPGGWLIGGMCNDE